MKRYDIAWLFGGLACIAVVTFLGWGMGSGILGDERARIQRQTDTYVNFLYTVRDNREARPELDQRISVILDRTLGGDRETADSVLREKLARLAASCGLRSPSVTTLPVVVRDSPAKSTFRRSGAHRPFREEPDFVELRAGIGAVGRLESVVEFLHALDAAPWLKRITSVRIDPEGDGRRLRLTLRLATIFVPGQGPGETASELKPTPRHDLDRYAALVESNPFALPKKPEPASRASKPVPAAPVARDPRAEWRLTAIIEGPDGAEAWLVNLLDQRVVEIRVGDALAGMALRAAEVDVATFAEGEKTLRVMIGSTLDQPLP